MRVLVGTEHGLWQSSGEVFEPIEGLTTGSVSALAQSGDDVWATIEDSLLHWTGGHWAHRASLGSLRATCLASTANGLLIGTAEAHLFRLVRGRLEPVESFEAVEGRDAWFTPWGDPADVRSIAVGLDGAIYVNVHVGGVVRSRDDGRSWTPTLDIESDVHQVIAHPSRGGVVLAAAYKGFGLSRDGGDTWRFNTDGLPVHYARAVALAGETVFLSASTGPGGHRAALYRKALDGDTKFVQCTDRLPQFDHNIDTACVATVDSLVVFGTADGRVFRSVDGGEHWALAAKGLPAVTAVVVCPA